eukprot:1850671-Lingulodinium_polyedra.AAC.1
MAEPGGARRAREKELHGVPHQRPRTRPLLSHPCTAEDRASPAAERLAEVAVPREELQEDL